MVQLINGNKTAGTDFNLTLDKVHPLSVKKSEHRPLTLLSTADLFVKSDKLPSFMQTRYELAVELAKTRYFIINEKKPWDKGYLTNLLTLQNEAVPLDKVTSEILQNRVNWLADLSEISLNHRIVELQGGSSTAFGVIKQAVISGTYKCLATGDKAKLLTQKELLSSHISVVDTGGSSSVSTLTKLLAKHSYDEELHEGIKHSALGRTSPNWRTNEKVLYYSRFPARATFVVRCLLHGATQLAQQIFHNRNPAYTQGWEYFWETELGHDFTLVNHILHEKTKNRS